MLLQNKSIQLTRLILSQNNANFLQKHDFSNQLFNLDGWLMY